MRFGNARQCVHDAFATNLTTPDRMEAGGTRYNSNGAICHQAEAGKIIKAVTEQKPHLRGICIFLNGPDGLATQFDIASLKIKLWADFVKKGDVEPRIQGEIVAILDHILLNYRRRCHDHSSGDVYISGAMSHFLGRTTQSFLASVQPFQDRILDILDKYDHLSLQPVWNVVNEERLKLQNEREAV